MMWTNLGEKICWYRSKLAKGQKGNNEEKKSEAKIKKSSGSERGNGAYKTKKKQHTKINKIIKRCEDTKRQKKHINFAPWTMCGNVDDNGKVWLSGVMNYTNWELYLGRRTSDIDRTRCSLQKRDGTLRRKSKGNTDFYAIVHTFRIDIQLLDLTFFSCRFFSFLLSLSFPHTHGNWYAGKTRTTHYNNVM